MRKRELLPGLLFAFSTVLWGLPSTVAASVRQDLSLGRADQALQQLDSALARNPSDADAHNLRCRVYYEEEQWDQAINDCESAVRLDPANSSYHLWLGRAYGLRASHVSIVSGYKLAHKVAAEFQQAVQLDPRNADALSDLGQFDLEAPAVAGGGVKKAAVVVQQLQNVDPPGSLTLEARIAESRGDYPAAEADFKAAIAESPRPASAWIDLADFYLRRKRFDDMLAALRSGVAADPRHGPSLVQAADDLAKAGLQPQTAIQWLREYLSSPAQSEDEPAFAVRADLARLLQSEGDTGGARQQLAAAHSLASAYRVPGLSITARSGQ